MDLHMREFDGTTFGMSVEASSPAFRRMKKNAFTGKNQAPWKLGRTEYPLCPGRRCGRRHGRSRVAGQRITVHGNHPLGQ